MCVGRHEDAVWLRLRVGSVRPILYCGLARRDKLRRSFNAEFAGTCAAHWPDAADSLVQRGAFHSSTTMIYCTGLTLEIVLLIVDADERQRLPD